TAQDPLGAAGGDPDWYGYCLDDPVNAVDKTGLHGKFEKKDSVNDTRNIPSPKTRVDLAQPQLSIVGKNKIQQNDAPTASTIWGLEQSVNRGAALKELIGPDLERWGKTMKNAGPLVISVFEEGRKDGFEPADIPRGILKSFWIGE
ncbi:hypothetical protein SAMN02745704_02942, partial [Paucidesulfovibrio gracilis DSM 16080]